MNAGGWLQQQSGRTGCQDTQAAQQLKCKGPHHSLACPHSRWNAVRLEDAWHSVSTKSSVAPNVVCRRRGLLGGLSSCDAAAAADPLSMLLRVLVPARGASSLVCTTPGPPPSPAVELRSSRADTPSPEPSSSCRLLTRRESMPAAPAAAAAAAVLVGSSGWPGPSSRTPCEARGEPGTCCLQGQAQQSRAVRQQGQCAEAHIR